MLKINAFFEYGVPGTGVSAGVSAESNCNCWFLLSTACSAERFILPIFFRCFVSAHVKRLNFLIDKVIGRG